MKRWIAGVILLFSMILLSVNGYFLADMLLLERKDDVLQEQLKEIYEDSKNREAAMKSFVPIPVRSTLS